MGNQVGTWPELWAQAHAIFCDVKESGGLLKLALVARLFLEMQEEY